MADFNTHLTGAVIVSGLAATVLVMAGQFSHQAIVGYFVLGVVGGLLPDIDSPTSIPVRLAFMVVAVIAGFLLIFTFSHYYSLLELVILWLGCFIVIRFGVFNLLDALTVHRGLVHSIPAGIGFGFFTVFVAYHFFDTSAVHAWFCGAFVTLGFFVHLLLDELYSVDLFGKKVLKRSFGTAFSLGDMKKPFSTIMLYFSLVGLFYCCPSPRPFTDLLLHRIDYQSVTRRMLPSGTWFSDFLQQVTPGQLYRP